MGFIEKLRHELVDIVEWVDDGRRTLVWRFPRYHNQIKSGAHLIVRPGQTAVFVHQGRIADVFPPGQYRLETRNLPIFSTLAGIRHGFESPFKAEVYFVSTRTITELKWGTPSPVLMRDADFGSVRVRAFGTFTLRAQEPRTLLSQLVGTDASFETDEIHELLRAVINQSFADVIAKSEISLLDLASNYATLAEEVRRTALSRVDDEYGLEIPQLFLVNVSVPAEIEQALDARTSMSVLGNLADYQRYQLGAATPEAARNPAGGVAGAGLGVGMGMAMAQHLAPATAPADAPPPPPPPAVWHIVENGQSVGPFTPDALAQAIAAGRVRAETLVWTPGMRAWTPAADVSATATLLRNAPPPLPR